MQEYDKVHPERRQKIGLFLSAVWEKIPEVKIAMSKFSQQQKPFVQSVIKKNIEGKPLTDIEKRIYRSFYKKFWKENPDALIKYRQACKTVQNEHKNNYKLDK